MIAKLIVASGKSAGRAIAIKRNKLLIGRAEQCDIRPLSEEVSRRHCAITVGPTDVWVEDLGSRNGTFVNGTKITERTKVVNGDLIRVATLELTVSCTAPAQPFSGSDDDVSRLLMADDEPAGMSDTTRSLTASSDDGTAVDSVHESGVHTASPESTLDGSFVSGIDAVPTDDSSSGSSRSAIDALKAAKSKPAGLPQVAKKPAADSSRDAAAEALKKFFERK